MTKQNSVYDENKQGDVILYGLVQDLKKHMSEQGVSYNELARRTNGAVSNATVSRILSGKTYPAFGTIYELYKVLNIELVFSAVVLPEPEQPEVEEKPQEKEEQ